MRLRKEFQSWKRVERDMRAAGHPEAGIQKAKESYCQAMDLLCRILQRMSLNDGITKDVSCIAKESV